MREAFEDWHFAYTSMDLPEFVARHAQVPLDEATAFCALAESGAVIEGAEH